MPGCTKPCYTDKTRKPYDFCGKTHADSYKTMMEEFEKEKARKKRITHFSHRDSSHGSGIIRFYDRDNPFYEFTNCYSAPIVLDGKLWPTTEHYFQAQKFIGTPFSEVIRTFQNPREAFDCARRPTVSYWLRNDWESVKVDIMRKALLAKFTQYERLRKLLLSTQDYMLVEHSPYDSFWGNGGDDSGDNKLGVLLMEIRYDFKERSKAGGCSSATKAAISSRGSYSGSSRLKRQAIVQVEATKEMYKDFGIILSKQPYSLDDVFGFLIVGAVKGSPAYLKLLEDKIRIFDMIEAVNDRPCMEILMSSVDPQICFDCSVKTEVSVKLRINRSISLPPLSNTLGIAQNERVDFTHVLALLYHCTGTSDVHKPFGLSLSKPASSSECMVEEVTRNTPAFNSGVKVGDRIGLYATAATDRISDNKFAQRKVLASILHDLRTAFAKKENLILLYSSEVLIT